MRHQILNFSEIVNVAIEGAFLTRGVSLAAEVAARGTSTNAKLIPKEKPHVRRLFTAERACIRYGSE